MQNLDKKQFKESRKFHNPETRTNHPHYYYYYTSLTAFFPGQPGKAGTKKGKTSLDLNQARNDGVLDGSSISWTICKQSASHSRQTTTPTPHHQIIPINSKIFRTLFMANNQTKIASLTKC